MRISGSTLTPSLSRHLAEVEAAIYKILTTTAISSMVPDKILSVQPAGEIIRKGPRPPGQFSK